MTAFGLADREKPPRYMTPTPNGTLSQHFVSNGLSPTDRT